MAQEREITELRELQEIALDGLRTLRDVCGQNGLTYMLAGGTLLGAVRHKGFIPWDDDIDVVMPREDYEKLKQLDPSAFGPDWRLYSFDTVPGYDQLFAKLCSTRTEKRPSPFHSGLRYGISVDIFPYDSLRAADDREAAEKAAEMRRLKRHYIRLLRPFRVRRQDLPGRVAAVVFRAQYHVMKRILSVRSGFGRLEAKRMEQDETTAYIIVHDDIYRQIWRREDVIRRDAPMPQLEFEGEMYNVPVDYDKMLKGNYGDYMQLPPVEKRVSGHTFRAYLMK